MNLSRQQQVTLRRLTNTIQDYCMPDEVMHYHVQPLTYVSSKSVMLTASNNGSPWYARNRMAVIIIGARGGIDRKNAILENIGKAALQ